MAACWTRRGCDDEMMAECMHAKDPEEKCPASCMVGKCYRETHVVTSDPALVFEPFVDRTVAAKEQCLFCEFFLTHGPRTD